MASGPTSTQEMFSPASLLRADAFPHPVTRLRLLETHISWVILTGNFAYKIKKPVLFDFVDYSTLENRLANCRKEIELNQRYSDDIYLGVAPIFYRDGNWCVGSESDDNGIDGDSPKEFAVKMREFDQDSILAHQLKNTQLNCECMEQFARRLADFHQSEPSIRVQNINEEIEKFHHEVVDNFLLLRRPLSGTLQAPCLETVAEWSERNFNTLQSKLRERIAQGFLKRCHGDLHLSNIILFEDELVPFDGIEFNEHLQTIDPLNEVAFLFMDLVAHEYDVHAWRLLNSYLEVAGDYQYLDLFRFFTVYRAMVRAKVAWINSQSESPSSGHYSSWLKPIGASKGKYAEPVHPWDHYLEYALRTTERPSPRLSITFGFSGSGKTTRALAEVEKGSVCLRSDVKRMKLKSEIHEDSLYSRETSDRIYQELLDQSRAVLEAGFSVVVDATFLKRSYRQRFQDLAAELGVPFQILACDAEFSELRTRIENRVGDASEADVNVLRAQMDSHDPLDDQEILLTKTQPEGI